MGRETGSAMLNCGRRRRFAGRQRETAFGPNNIEVSEFVRTANGGLNGRAGLHGVERREPIPSDCNGPTTFTG